MADEVCDECGREVGHSWTCSKGGNRVADVEWWRRNW
jgi:hypothetical protein